VRATATFPDDFNEKDNTATNALKQTSKNVAMAAIWSLMIVFQPPQVTRQPQQATDPPGWNSLFLR
jgi:hypothetical protein